MIKYMIHTCPKRMWYVNDFLVPSMKKQGIKEEEIYIYNDDLEDGNFLSSVKSFKLSLSFKTEYIWHLQDDVLLCSNFKDRADHMIAYMEEDGIMVAAGFCGIHDSKNKINGVTVKDLWYSFPCICIKRSILVNYYDWVMKVKDTSKLVQEAIRTMKIDDGVFAMYLKNVWQFAKCYNIMPNLVEHIDWLIGYSSVGNYRANICRSVCFEEQELVDELRDEISRYNKNIEVQNG